MTYKDEIIDQIEILKKAQQYATDTQNVGAVDFISQTILKYLEMLEVA